MNMLIDRLPKTVPIGGKDVPIRTDFRISMMFELLMTDAARTDEEKIIGALNLYYKEMPSDLNEAAEQMILFYKCGKEENEYTKKLAESKSERKRVYSFDYDDDYIYAAFLGQYGVDLNSAKMHWWKFRAMFNGLTDDNEFVKIMSYRAIDITRDMSKSQQDFYRKMKRIHEIPQSKEEQEKQNQIEQILMHGGDLSGLL
jgi:hypothetical protein